MALEAEMNRLMADEDESDDEDTAGESSQLFRAATQESSLGTAQEQGEQPSKAVTPARQEAPVMTTGAPQRSEIFLERTGRNGTQAMTHSTAGAMSRPRSTTSFTTVLNGVMLSPVLTPAHGDEVCQEIRLRLE